MSLEKQLLEDMKLAMKSGDKSTLDTIRLLRSQIKTASIDKKAELSESELTQVLQKEAKKRRESIAMFKQGNREDLVNKEAAELEIINRYLPEQLSVEALRAIVKETAQNIQVASEKDMGRLMGAVMPKVQGKADGKFVQEIVKNYLADL
jgi:uncharacterized protein YqeY